MKAKAHSIPESFASRKVRFDLFGFNAEVEGSILSLDVPTVQFEAPILSKEALDCMRDNGFSDIEIEGMIDEIFNKIEVRILSNILTERKVR